MWAWFRTSRRTGIIFPFPLIALVFLWPLFIIWAVWKFTGDRSIDPWIRFWVGFGLWVLIVLAVSGQVR